MSLPWVRLDANIASHDKITGLLAERDGHRAFTLYVCALGWAGGHGTDGHIPRHILPMIHGTERLARLLVDHRLWRHHDGGGWTIHNYSTRQELAVITEGKRASQRAAARRTNCTRYHGPDCGCWREAS
jgi:hypothetical protein